MVYRVWGREGDEKKRKEKERNTNMVYRVWKRKYSEEKEMRRKERRRREKKDDGQDLEEKIK